MEPKPQNPNPQEQAAEVELRTPRQQFLLDAHGAPTYDNFWEVADAYMQATPDVNPAFINAQYEEWRHTSIVDRITARARTIVESSPNVLPELAIEGCDSITIEPQAAQVAYSSTDELVADLRHFFAPRREQTEQEAADEQQRVRNASQSYLYRHLAYTDVAITDRIEQELAEWEHQGAHGTYVDSQAAHDSHPYRDALGKTHYDDKKVEVTRNEQGEFLLNIRGGYGGPTQQTQDFAAYCGKEITFTGPVLLRYLSKPFAYTPVADKNAVGDYNVAGKVPISAIRTHVQAVTGVSNKTLANLEGVVFDMATKAYVSREDAVVKDDAATIEVTSSTSLPRGVTFTADGRSYYGDMPYFKAVDLHGTNCFVLPKVELLVQLTDLNRASEIIRLLQAQSVLAQQDRPSYDDGMVMAGMFYPNPVDEFGQPFSHRESATAPQSEVNISQPQLSREEHAQQPLTPEDRPDAKSQGRDNLLRRLGLLVRKWVG